MMKSEQAILDEIHSNYIEPGDISRWCSSRDINDATASNQLSEKINGNPQTVCYFQVRMKVSQGDAIFWNKIKEDIA